MHTPLSPFCLSLLLSFSAYLCVRVWAHVCVCVSMYCVLHVLCCMLYVMCDVYCMFCVATCIWCKLHAVCSKYCYLYAMCIACITLYVLYIVLWYMCCVLYVVYLVCFYAVCLVCCISCVYTGVCVHTYLHPNQCSAVPTIEDLASIYVQESWIWYMCSTVLARRKISKKVIILVLLFLTLW